MSYFRSRGPLLPQVVSIGQPIETNFAQTVAKLKQRAIGQASESDSALAVALLGAVESDWQARSSAPGVLWLNGFKAASEVNAFRWTGGFGGGNDPDAVGTVRAALVSWQAGEGPGGSGCLQILRQAGTQEVGSHWWRPLSPIVGSGNGRGIDDPGAGTLTPQAYAATSGGSQIASWGSRGFYGHSSYHTGNVFDGREYYLQMRIKMDPRRAAPGLEDVGKLTFQTRTDVSLTTQELVTYSGGLHSNNPNVNYLRIYGGGNSNPLEQKAVGSSGGNQPGNVDGVCTLSANPNTCWAWSGGWDTIVYHLMPGRDGVAESRIRVYAAHEDDTRYTLIWDMVWANGYGSGHPFGYNALMCSTYNNSTSENPVFFPEFWHRYSEIICSKDFPLLPGTHDTPLGTACRELAVGDTATFSPGTGHGLSSAQMDWQNSFWLDPVRNVVHFLGKTAGLDNDWRQRTFALATNGWTNNDHNWSRAGHPYGSTDIDPATGDLYMVPGSGSSAHELWRRNAVTGVWTMLVADFSPDTTENPPHGLAWHPNLYGQGDGGVVICAETSTPNNSLCFYRKSTGALQRVALGTTVGGTSPQGVYLPRSDVVVIGRTTHFMVSPNGGALPIVTNIGAPPLDTSANASGNNRAAMIEHPGDPGRLLAFEKLGTSRYWESSDGNNWTLVGTHPFPNSNNNPMVLCSLKGTGCVWRLGYSGGLVSTLFRPPV